MYGILLSFVVVLVLFAPGWPLFKQNELQWLPAELPTTVVGSGSQVTPEAGSKKQN